MRDDIISFLVLDYRKEKETRLCLESIRQHAKIPYQIIYLDNGSGDSFYPWRLYQDGLADVIISKKIGMGGGVGQTDLFRYCDTKYAFFVQSDQILIHDITPYILEQFISFIVRGTKCIDLNGDQSGKKRWTDRAHLIDVEWFNSLAPFPNGGPGPLHHLRWNENYLQEVFDKLNNPIAHINPVFFIDNGVWTIRELPDKSIVRMKTDTKEVHWDKLPTEKYVFPDLTDEEWQLSFNGEWINGTIPERYKEHSFKHWRD